MQIRENEDRKDIDSVLPLQNITTNMKIVVGLKQLQKRELSKCLLFKILFDYERDNDIV